MSYSPYSWESGSPETQPEDSYQSSFSRDVDLNQSQQEDNSEFPAPSLSEADSDGPPSASLEETEDENIESEVALRNLLRNIGTEKVKYMKDAQRNRYWQHVDTLIEQQEKTLAGWKKDEYRMLTYTSQVGREENEELARDMSKVDDLILKHKNLMTRMNRKVQNIPGVRVTVKGPIKDEIAVMPEHWERNVHLSMLGTIKNKINGIGLDQLKKEKYTLLQKIREEENKISGKDAELKKLRWVMNAGKWAGNQPEFELLRGEAKDQKRHLKEMKQESMNKLSALRKQLRLKQKDIWQAKRVRKRYKAIQQSDTLRLQYL